MMDFTFSSSQKPSGAMIKHALFIATTALFGNSLHNEAPAQKPNRYQSKNPNVIVILSDDQGWGDLSITGNTNLETPNIDALGHNGAQFENFYVQPVSSPTRAELLTGRYHPHSNVYSTSAGGERMDLDETTIAEVFQSAGYETAAFGKWHNGMQHPYHPNARGFDEFYGFCSGHWGDYFSPMLEHNGKLVQGDGYIINDLTEKAMKFIEEKREEPFFLYLPYNTPHSPMQVPDRWWDKFEDATLNMHHRDPEKEDMKHLKAALAMCENIDWNVGRLMDKLEKLGLKENTIVVYFSDNGPNGWRWNEGMKGRKGSTDEGGVRSPLFIRWPGVIKADTKIDEIAGAIDLLPTLADLAGIKPETNKPVEGVSLEPLLFRNDESWNSRLLYSFWGGRASVRSQQFRLDGEGRLFDIEKDRGQYIDVSDKNPQVADRLEDSLSAWKKEMTAELDRDSRPFPIGHSDFKYTQMPARDAEPHGNIERSNRFPNCTFFTNWTASSDKITWDAEVLSEGDYQVKLYYTCSRQNLGSIITLSMGSAEVTGKITEAHDPPLRGMEDDRVERQESYVKAFKPMNLGIISLEEGRGTLTLKAKEIPGGQAMDFRLLIFERID
ncbi:MAG: arylsulfatase [Bacteroidales bacterium]